MATPCELRPPELAFTSHAPGMRPIVPAALADVCLIDADTAAAVGGMSVSWWLEEVRSSRAPKPVVQRPRCTRWQMLEVREFWKKFAETGATEAGRAMCSKLTSASQKAREQRAAKAGA